MLPVHRQLLVYPCAAGASQRCCCSQSIDLQLAPVCGHVQRCSWPLLTLATTSRRVKNTNQPRPRVPCGTPPSRLKSSRTLKGASTTNWARHPGRQ
jgi:hypothetical protein